ncbi:MAG: DUF1080 domain-containing protein [Fuerstiella sp.]
MKHSIIYQIAIISAICGRCELLDAQTVTEKVTKATAFVKQTPVGDGTAFCIRADGLFVTNWHVVQNVPPFEEVPLILNSGQPGKERQVKARLLSLNRQWDLALLRVDGRNDWPALEIVAEDYKAELGQVVQAYGFPFGTIPDGGNPSITMNQGRISSLSRDDDGSLSDIRFDAVVNPGNSGGPLVDEQGRVLGVVKAKIGERTSFAVGFKRLREFLKQPGLSMETEVAAWDERGQPMDFHIRVVTDFGAIRPDSVEVEISADGETKQVHRADLPATQDQLVIKAAPDPRKELNLVLRRSHSSNKPKEEELLRVADRVIHAPTGTRISDIARLIRMPNDRVAVELRSGKSVKTELKNLVDAEKLLPNNAWDGSTVHVDDPRAGYIDCVVRARKDGEILKEASLTFPLTQRPVFAQFPGDPPVLGENGPLEEIQVQIPFEGSVTFNVGRFVQRSILEERSFTGIALVYPAGRQPPPGNFSLMGPFVRVNGKLWHYGVSADSRYPSNILPVDLKEGTWDCEVVRNWSAATEKKELLKGEVSIQHREDKRTVVTIRTPEGKNANYQLRFFVKQKEEDDDTWSPIFDGKSLTGWELQGGQRDDWKVESGRLVGMGRRNRLLYTKKPFEDVDIRVECRLSERVNSGLFLKAPRELSQPGGFEAQIASTNSAGNPKYLTGALFGKAAFEESLVSPGEWFTLEARCRQRKITLLLNGRRTVDYEIPANSPKSGYIALQGWSGGPIEFRRIEVRAVDSK